MIELKDVSVVVQGRCITDLTTQCLRSVRRVLPDVEIILATYIDTNTDGLDYDKIALVEDPVCFPHDNSPHAKLNNINRQIQTTLAGLKVATRKYAFKLRSDFVLNGPNFISYFNQFPKSDPKYKIFEKKY